MLYWFLKILCFIPYWIMFPTFVKGRKNLPKGKCVFIVNHRSNFDPPLMLNMFWRTQHTLAKQELFKNKLGAAFFKGMKAIPINREKVEISTVKQCLGVLKKGGILTVFPEGTRNTTNKPLGEIKGGAAIFAIKAESPIVPIWIKNKPKLFRFNRIYVGKPFYITKDQSAESDNIMRDKLLELSELIINKNNR
ncbi:MAG: 1-acyl-sn-glycerol-3-phosphate acyltransferase [Clostridia bacterium]|nr:1-acyl-sn-glycerol-3-phosphate acyltransferase [Clostridia bacterium]